MSTTSTVRAWSTTPSNNNTADSDITSADTQAPDTLDNNIRSIMAGVKKQENDTGGSLAAGGTADALTVTTNQVLESGQIVAGLRLLIRATADNTSTTVTFAPDGLTAANIKRVDGSALAIGSIKSGMYLDLVYNTGSSEWRAANIEPASVVGLTYLTSGTVAAATLDIVLTAYTSYRGIKIFLSGFRPATDAVALWMRTSSNGGSNYDSSSSDYNYVNAILADSAASETITTSGGDSKIKMTNNDIGNTSTYGYNGEITLLNQTSTAFWSRVFHNGYYISSASAGVLSRGGGAREQAQDTDAVRFYFSSGNISAGNYAVYGLG